MPNQNATHNCPSLVSPTSSVVCFTACLEGEKFREGSIPWRDFPQLGPEALYLTSSFLTP
jgi:hypothetical protein